MEECNLLANARKPVKEELDVWKSRHIHKPTPKKKKGPVEPEKEEEEKLERFFCQIHEFHNSVPNPQPAFIPTALPPCLASSPSGHASSPSTEYSVVSSACFTVAPSPSTDYSVVSSACFAAPSTDYSAVSSACFDAPTEYSVVPSACFAVPSSPTCIANS